MFTGIIAIWAAAIALTSFTTLTWDNVLPFAIALSVAALWPLISRLFGALPFGLGGEKLKTAEDAAKSGATGIGFFAGWFFRRLYLLPVSIITLAVYIFTAMVLAKPITLYGILFYPLLILCFLLCVGVLWLLYVAYSEKNEKRAIQIGFVLAGLCIVALVGFFWWENIALGDNISKHLMEGDESGTYAHWEQMPLVSKGGAKYDVHFSGMSQAATTTTKKSGWWIFAKTVVTTVPMEPVPPGGINMLVPCPSDTNKMMLLGTPYFEFVPAGSSVVNVIEITNRRDYAGRHIARHTKIVGVELDSMAVLSYGELWGTIAVPDSGALILKVAYPAGYTYTFEYTLTMQRDPGKSKAELAVKNRFGLGTTKKLGVLLYMGVGLMLLGWVQGKAEERKMKGWKKAGLTLIFIACYILFFFFLLGREAAIPGGKTARFAREIVRQKMPGVDTTINEYTGIYQAANASTVEIASPTPTPGTAAVAFYQGNGSAAVLKTPDPAPLMVHVGDSIAVQYYGTPDSTTFQGVMIEILDVNDQRIVKEKFRVLYPSEMSSITDSPRMWPTGNSYGHVRVWAPNPGAYWVELRVSLKRAKN